MILSDNMKCYSIGEFTHKIGKTIQTLRNSDKNNTFKSTYVTASGITNSEIEKIEILYKDRLIRIGYELIENFCEKYGTIIEIIDNTERAEEQELVEDLIQIMIVFGCRLQGKRVSKTKKMIKELMEDDRKYEMNKLKKKEVYVANL